MFKRKPKLRKTVESLWKLEKLILNSLDFNHVVQEICDGIILELGYLHLGYEIVVLCLKDEKNKKLHRVSISKTEKAQLALKKSPVPFKEIAIPLKDKNNILIKALKKGIKLHTTNWKDILVPAFTEQEAKEIQESLGIKASLVYPIFSQKECIGTLIFSMNKPISKVTTEENDLIESFTDLVGLAVQNASLYSQLENVNRELKTANRDLRRLDKLKDEFVYIATHELKTPVTVMKGYLSMINDGSYGEVSDKMKEALNEIAAANEQLVQLVNDLLEIARSEAKQITIDTQATNICSIADETLKSVKPLADKKKLKLAHACGLNHVYVKADPNKLQEIFNNLVSNAIKYSETGTISISHVVEKDRIITHVKDQGFGLSDEDQKHVFNRFFRAENHAGQIPGTGLGLFIVKQLIEKMGGRIWFTSKLGEGTTFSFSLPKGDPKEDKLLDSSPRFDGLS